MPPAKLHAPAAPFVDPRPLTFGSAPARGVFMFLLLVGAAAGLAAGFHPAASLADPALTRLLRAMAVIKAFVAAAAAAVLYWRLSAPVAAWRFAAYAAAAATMAAGPGLIWHMTHIAAGALLLHGGLLATIILLWRDPGMAMLLENTITAKKRRRYFF